MRRPGWQKGPSPLGIARRAKRDPANRGRQLLLGVASACPLVGPAGGRGAVSAPAKAADPRTAHFRVSTCCTACPSERPSRGDGDLVEACASLRLRRNAHRSRE
eukprot:4397752-Alexandrium_andersonii.AAC.1